MVWRGLIIFAKNAEPSCFARRAVFLSLSGGQPLSHNNEMAIQPPWDFSAENEKPHKLCVLCDSSAAGGEIIQTAGQLNYFNFRIKVKDV
jgi:hypothetical protein